MTINSPDIAVIQVDIEKKKHHSSSQLKLFPCRPNSKAAPSSINVSCKFSRHWLHCVLQVFYEDFKIERVWWAVCEFQLLPDIYHVCLAIRQPSPSFSAEVMQPSHRLLSSVTPSSAKTRGYITTPTGIWIAVLSHSLTNTLPLQLILLRRGPDAHLHPQYNSYDFRLDGPAPLTAYMLHGSTGLQYHIVCCK